MSLPEVDSASAIESPTAPAQPLLDVRTATAASLRIGSKTATSPPTVPEDKIFAVARNLDAERSAGHDAFDMTGMATTCGSYSLVDSEPADNSQGRGHADVYPMFLS
ncbi:hypothetical protein B0T26DRAFT_671006 [Lasiosphaeria miniovina]|uniref:Uncharacterized protein n=1 Tax=Lasiosphaeria miniovina TaxID=1954250 RepID=A0AA40EAU3_9PEZI|nr:uncharacterized protein B0T26DRAFT_671006 [Lasiosphaeria miniovina]KAK0734764.1 hypothetical protein B0T26DRAFT_671006 [Lasiosphaeria miniovina]